MPASCAHTLGISQMFVESRKEERQGRRKEGRAEGGEGRKKGTLASKEEDGKEKKKKRYIRKRLHAELLDLLFLWERRGRSLQSIIYACREG